MYLLDTNVLSEVMRETPAQPVIDWLQSCPPDAICTATICEAEILFGILRLEAGQRRTRLLAAARQLFDDSLAGRVLPFDRAAAQSYGTIRVKRRQSGTPISTEDCMIAGIAQAHALSVVTRDEGGFHGTGIAIINPWASH